jgi:hypothetical protein
VSAVARANGLSRARNGRAWASVVVGAAAVLVCPLAIGVSRYFDELTLVQSCASAIVAFVLGTVAIVLARRGEETSQLTLGRSGGQGAARTGRIFGLVALWIAATIGLAVGFYWLLTLFAD